MPPPLWHPSVAIVQLDAIAGNFQSGYCRDIAIRARPRGGRAGVRGAFFT